MLHHSETAANLASGIEQRVSLQATGKQTRRMAKAAIHVRKAALLLAKVEKYNDRLLDGKKPKKDKKGK